MRLDTSVHVGSYRVTIPGSVNKWMDTVPYIYLVFINIRIHVAKTSLGQVSNSF